MRLTRTQQQAVTRERLLTAAERVVARLGFGGASLDLIALEAGFSKGAVYSNFASKEEVFLGLLQQYMERDLSELERLVVLESKALKLAITEWLETMYADNDCPLLVAELQLHARRSQDFAKQYYALQERQAQTLACILERYFKALSKRSPIAPIDLARSLLALAQGLSLQHPPSKPGTPNSTGRVIDSMLKILTR